MGLGEPVPLDDLSQRSRLHVDHVDRIVSVVAHVDPASVRCKNRMPRGGVYRESIHRGQGASIVMTVIGKTLFRQLMKCYLPSYLGKF